LDVLFDGPHDQARWDVRWRHDKVEVESFEYRLDVAAGAVTPEAGDSTPPSPPEAHQDAEDPYVILAVRRGKRMAPFCLGYDPRQGDIAAVAIHRPARQNAVDHLTGLGWRPLDTAL
jgi:hypothetical protein